MLSILCITKNEPFAQPFLRAMGQLAADVGGEFVVGLDTAPDTNYAIPDADKIVSIEAHGYLEKVHDTVLGYCEGDYVLRLDDDERCSPAMAAWIKNGRYLDASHWKFPRAHLWPAAKPSMIMTPHLWPDHQTRLSVREMAGGRNAIHAGSPFGGGEAAEVLIEHHKFLVKSLDERREIVRRYDSIMQGAGTMFAAFSTPEDFYRGQRFKVIPLNDGRTDVGHYVQDCGACGKWVTL